MRIFTYVCIISIIITELKRYFKTPWLVTSNRMTKIVFRKIIKTKSEKWTCLSFGNNCDINDSENTNNKYYYPISIEIPIKFNTCLKLFYCYLIKINRVEASALSHQPTQHMHTRYSDKSELMSTVKQCLLLCYKYH